MRRLSFMLSAADRVRGGASVGDSVGCADLADEDVADETTGISGLKLTTLGLCYTST
jgi:hypothetical protein